MSGSIPISVGEECRRYRVCCISGGGLLLSHMYQTPTVSFFFKINLHSDSMLCCVCRCLCSGKEMTHRPNSSIFGEHGANCAVFNSWKIVFWTWSTSCCVRIFACKDVYCKYQLIQRDNFTHVTFSEVVSDVQSWDHILYYTHRQTSLWTLFQPCFNHRPSYAAL